MKTRSTRKLHLKIAAASALFVLCSYAAIGQAPDGPPPGPPPDAGQSDGPRMPNTERQLNQLTHLLNLTADQQKGVKTVLEQQATEMKALRAKSQADPSTGQTPESFEARRTQMEQIREETNTKIAALLDDTQKTTFAAWVAKHKRHQAQESQDGPPPPPPDGGGPSDGGGGPPPSE